MDSLHCILQLLPKHCPVIANSQLQFFRMISFAVMRHNGSRLMRGGHPMNPQRYILDVIDLSETGTIRNHHSEDLPSRAVPRCRQQYICCTRMPRLARISPDQPFQSIPRLTAATNAIFSYGTNEDGF
jgi:hypothetical protein